MYAKSRRRGRLVPAFGLALVAMLAFGGLIAGAAQAAPTWHINGTTFTGEAGVSWSSGPVTLSVPAMPGWEVTCTSVSSSNAKIKESTKSSGEVTFSSCTAPQMHCTVEPLHLSFTGVISGPVGAQDYEKLNAGGSWNLHGEACFFEGLGSIGGSTAAAVGAEAVSSSRTFSSTAESTTGATGITYGGFKWKVSGQAATALTGTRYGQKYGTGFGGQEAWTPEATATWTVAGKAFSGTESINVVEGSINITNPATGVKIECKEPYGGGTIMESNRDETYFASEACQIPSIPTCTVGFVWLAWSGQIGKESGKVYERFDLRPAPTEIIMEGSGCPYTGGEINGSIGAYLHSEGINNKASFSQEATKVVRGSGLEFNNEIWYLTSDLGLALWNTNKGKAFGTQ